MPPWTKGVAIGKSLGLIIIVILMLLVMVVGGDLVMTLISLGAENQIQHQNVELASDMTITSAFPEETSLQKRTLLISDCDITFKKDFVRSRIDVQDEDDLTTKTYWNFHKSPTYPRLQWEKNQEVGEPPSGATGISDWYDLDEVRDNPTEDYFLENDLDEDTAGYDELVDTEDGWKPIGNENNYFMGVFDGQGHTVSDLYINRSGEQYIGLFGYIYDGEIRNTGVENVKVIGGNEVGGLLGRAYFSDVKNSYATGSVQGSSSVGGLIGSSSQDTSDILNSYAKTDAKGNEKVGGLVGSFSNGIISRSFSKGNVKTKAERVGGLVGITGSDGGISNSYSLARINGEDKIGGLVGEHLQVSDPIEQSYSAGNINYSTGSRYIGGIAGSSDGIVNYSFWNMVTAGISPEDDFSGAGEPLFMAEMTSRETFEQGQYTKIDPEIKRCKDEDNHECDDPDEEVCLGDVYDAETGNDGDRCETGARDYPNRCEEGDTCIDASDSTCREVYDADTGYTGESCDEEGDQDDYEGWDFEDTWYIPEQSIRCGNAIEIKDGRMNRVVEEHADL